MPGGAAVSEERKSPVCDLVVSACRLADPLVQIVWIATAEEQAELRRRTASARIIFLEPHAGIERTMIGADVAITKATRITCLELSALGIPSISLSYGLNPVDDYRVARIRTNRTLRVRGLTETMLGGHITDALRESREGRTEPADLSYGRLRAVERLLWHIRKPTRSRPDPAGPEAIIEMSGREMSGREMACRADSSGHLDHT
jgi:hypothetical protein